MADIGWFINGKLSVNYIVYETNTSMFWAGVQLTLQITVFPVLCTALLVGLNILCNCVFKICVCCTHHWYKHLSHPSAFDFSKN